MKKLILLMAAVLMAPVAYAQSSLVATLSHDGEISVFHGASSLKQAMEAANHGDIITLASGRYDAVNIDKAVTLRGAGSKEDPVTGTFRTEIVGNFNINIADSIPEHLTIEGIYHGSYIGMYGTLKNAMLQKCQFYRIESPSSGYTVSSMTCIHCYFSYNIGLPSNCSANFISCVIRSPSNAGGNMEFTNCVILGFLNNTKNSYFHNCIMNGSWSLTSTNMATYCVGYSSSSPFANLASQATNKTLSAEQMNALFKPDTFYELTDEAKTEYIGIDGKEVGIYGGNLPYETRILSPQITKCDVASKTTADGKLSVDIEVKAAE